MSSSSSEMRGRCFAKVWMDECVSEEETMGGVNSEKKKKSAL